MGRDGAGFVGHKLRIARTFQGIGQAELGERLAIGRALVGRIEAGSAQPAPELVAALAEELGFGAAFFETPLADAPRDEECHGLQGKAPRRRALAHASLLSELVAWLEDRVRLPEEQLPEIVAGGAAADAEGIEASAAACRSLWGLAPDLPVPDLVRVVERAGVVVARGSGDGAFARVGRRHLVVFDLGSHDARFELARLTGHVVLHRGVDAAEPRDAEARRFATALLLPRDGLLRELPRAPSLDWTALVPLAERWKVSLAALVQRAAELPVANAARYRDAAEYFAARGRAGYPGGGPRAATGERPAADHDERPEVIALALRHLEQGLGIRPAEVARRLGWSARVLVGVTGLDVGVGHRDNVVSLAAWKARRGTPATPVTPGSMARRLAPPRSTGGGAQLELDFGAASRTESPP